MTQRQQIWPPLVLILSAWGVILGVPLATAYTLKISTDPPTRTLSCGTPLSVDVSAGDQVVGASVVTACLDGGNAVMITSSADITITIAITTSGSVALTLTATGGTISVGGSITSSGKVPITP